MVKARPTGESSTWMKIKRNWGLYLLMVPAIIIFLCFTYELTIGARIQLYTILILFPD